MGCQLYENTSVVSFAVGIAAVNAEDLDLAKPVASDWCYFSSGDAGPGMAMRRIDNVSLDWYAKNAD